MSKLEETMFFHIKAAKLPLPVREHPFHPERKWRFDFAWPSMSMALEVEGLVHPSKKSRHTTNQGYQDDCEKYNQAVIHGWRVLRVTGQMVKSGNALLLLEEAFNQFQHSE